jgi:hypothetical protein
MLQLGEASILFLLILVTSMEIWSLFARGGRSLYNTVVLWIQGPHGSETFCRVRNSRCLDPDPDLDFNLAS